MTEQKLAYLRFYAQEDAKNKGVVPPIVDTASMENEIVILARFIASSDQFLPGDWNLDNQKRNLAIRLFIDFSFDEIRQYGNARLDKLSIDNSNFTWIQEWRKLLNPGSDDALARVLLSADEESTRLRSSKPISGLLDADTALQIKNSGMPI